MIPDWPSAVVAVTIWAYWGSVVSLVVHNNLRYRTAAGARPRTARERAMWAIWVPAIVLWHILPAVAAKAPHVLVGLPALLMESPFAIAVRSLAAAATVAAFLLTIPCWRTMGRNWSMAIVPGKRSRLITSGMFSRVRHPIYALSMLLMGGTMLAVPTPAMLAVGAVHVTMIYLKATGEERHMHGVHGEQYDEYCRRTGRFLPKLRTAEPLPSPRQEPQRKKAA